MENKKNRKLRPFSRFDRSRVLENYILMHGGYEGHKWKQFLRFVKSRFDVTDDGAIGEVVKRVQKYELPGRLINDRRFMEAINALYGVIELYPEFPDAYAEMAFCFLKTGDNKRAEEFIEAAFSRDPLNYKGLCNRAMVKVENYDHSGALEDLNKAIELEPGKVLAYERRGMMNFHLREFGSTIEDMTKAIEFEPGDPAYYVARGISGEMIADNEGALADYNKALEISNSYADAYNNRGEIYRKQNKLNEAMNDYRKAADLEKNFAEPHYNMGLILELQKRYDLAAREFETYLKLKPDAPDEQQLSTRIESLKKTAMATAPTAPAPGAPSPG
jgi:tetratricopeptide (TPR) repeat protein